MAWENDALVLLDQRLLPEQERYLHLDTVDGVIDAIQTMAVRGAPAIGITAAYGCVLAARSARQRGNPRWRDDFDTDLTRLAQARPTAVNLGWAIQRMRAAVAADESDPESRLLAEAQAIHEQDIATNRAMAIAGARYLSPGANVLTHCNTGALATGGIGTALGVIRAAQASGKLNQVFACEARPWLQGSRLTAWELLREGIEAKVIVDSAAALTIAEHDIEWVIVGADRIAANGDTANKIGTFNLALIARSLGAKFMVVAPRSTIDLSVASGRDIPLEHRAPDEVTRFNGAQITPPGLAALNPVFDVTPVAFIDLIVTSDQCLENPCESPPKIALKA